MLGTSCTTQRAQIYHLPRPDSEDQRAAKRSWVVGGELSQRPKPTGRSWTCSVTVAMSMTRSAG
jgi:hypothetical protein